MASIEKRGNSYRIKVSCGYKADGTQVFQRMTWTPDEKMTAKQIEKEVQRQAILFEEECKRGQIVSAENLSLLRKNGLKNMQSSI